MPHRPLNSLEFSRGQLTAKLFHNFRRLLANARINDPATVARPTRLPGMVELREKLGLSQRTFANWWGRFRLRNGSLRVQRGGRPQGVSKISGVGKGAKWLLKKRATLFPASGLIETYSTADILRVCMAHGAPFSTSRQLRRILTSIGENSRDMERHAKGIRRKKDQRKYQRRKLRPAVGSPSVSNKPSVRKVPEYFEGVDFDGLPQPPLAYFEGGLKRNSRFMWRQVQISLCLDADHMVHKSRFWLFPTRASDYICFGESDSSDSGLFAFDAEGGVFRFPAGGVWRDRAVKIASSWHEFQESLRPVE